MKHRDIISTASLTGLIFIPGIFNGGRETIGASIFAGLLFLYVWFRRSEGGNQNPPLSPFSKGGSTPLPLKKGGGEGFSEKSFEVWSWLSYASIAAFLCWTLIEALLFSPVPYISIRGLLPFVGAVIIFFIGAPQRSDRIFSWLLVCGAVAYVAAGVIFLMQSEAWGYLRLVSFFYQHNGLAGFLLFPLLVSLGMLWMQKTRGCIVAPAIFGFLVVGLVLTFSRGGMISAGAGILLFLCLVALASKNKKTSLSVIARSPAPLCPQNGAGRRSNPGSSHWDGAGLLCFVRNGDFRWYLRRLALVFFTILLAIAGVWGIRAAKTSQAARLGADVAAPYAAERAGETGWTARVAYAKYAMRLFAERPLAGHGFALYGTGARRIQNDIRFYSNDPHNFYLRILSELGIFGFIAFAVFVAAIGFMAIRHIQRRPDDILYVGFFSGWVALLIHNGGDVDKSFPANVAVFFAASAYLMHPMIEATSPFNKGGHREIFFVTAQFVRKVCSVRMIRYTGISVAFFLFLVSVRFWLAERAWVDAVGAKTEEEFAAYYKKTTRYDPFNPFYRFGASRAYEAFGDDGLALQALDETDRLYRNFRDAFIFRGSLAARRGDGSEAEKSWKKAMTLAPYKDLEPVLGLVGLYRVEGRVENLRSLIDGALARFPDAHLDSPLWVDPRKEDIKKHVLILKQLRDEASAKGVGW